MKKQLKPTSELARLLDTNANNIYKLLHDARLKLKPQLQARGLEPQYILNLFGENNSKVIPTVTVGYSA